MKRMTKAFQLSAKQVRVADRGREREEGEEDGRSDEDIRRLAIVGDRLASSNSGRKDERQRTTLSMNNMSILMPFMYSAPTSYRVLLNNASGYEFGLLDSHAPNNPTCSQAPQ
ncbi:uncharacterized protein LOC114286825 [Camellia sinensis]|uniref:uncharacterized protein LOC114286825 n=1 Tax=Camellia sinensis TaxID=4442 RepID=UPI001036EB19|nr:uncharacterized protein LOC114286825 [Camellia sinensis]